jgi:hypothetical protein
MKIAALTCGLVLTSAASAGGIVIDGVAESAYGKALSVQDTQTGFGDSNLGVIDFANGSELDQAFGIVQGDFLYLVFAGNLESNFNKLEVFIDYRKGGQNRLRGDNPDVDFNGLNRMGDNGTGNGLTFDTGFEADYYVTTTCGNNPLATFANTAQILTKGGGVGEYIGSGGAGTNTLNGSNGTIIGYDNSNVAGVPGGTKSIPGLGAGVTTGIEIALPLALLEGYAGGDLRISAFINGGGHDFASNQWLGGIGGGSNLGEPRDILLDFVPGEQSFTVPGPGKTEPCVGDLDGNGEVNASDLATLLSAWGGPAGDLNGDGTTTAADLTILLGAWGVCP